MIEIKQTTAEHVKYIPEIAKIVAETALAEEGISQRNPMHLKRIFEMGNAITALDGNEFIGACYLDVFNEEYVENSGLVVVPKYREQGWGRKIKEATFNLSRQKHPDSKIFALTTSGAVMKINSRLGYTPTNFLSLTQDEAFWEGCKSCFNYDVLLRNKKDGQYIFCCCTALIFDPKTNGKKAKK